MATPTVGEGDIKNPPKKFAEASEEKKDKAKTSRRIVAWFLPVSSNLLLSSSFSFCRDWTTGSEMKANLEISKKPISKVSKRNNRK
jgi:hypothetical protein